ncbi:hypothetical protein E5083_30485 [Streptomyces bauhiniae]|uniref:Uncharacterized protein n=1 Tax=Streptomyces bauhiniae TaxID=2340725 RepID=A0A4Z1CUG5_9ACTN|nr:hypothetical protein [Streptomyces bauhiniae]TGN72263.1 hypothetical protein E5083_30485 [Streptomyces bauhiniae]
MIDDLGPGFEPHLFLINGKPDPACCPCPRAQCGGLTKMLDSCPTHRPKAGDAPIMGMKSPSRCCPPDPQPEE